MRTADFALLLALGFSGSLAFGFTGCSGSTDGPGGGPAAAPIAQADLPAKASEAMCNNVGKCCTDWGFQFDAAKCAENVRQDVQKSIDSAAAAQGVSYNADAAGACVAVYGAIASGCIATDAQAKELEKACNAIWTGTKAQGEPCTEDFECAGADKGDVFCATIPAAPDAGPSSGPTCMGASGSPQHGTKGGPCFATMCPTSADSEGCPPTGSHPGAPAGAPYCFADDGLFCNPEGWQCAELAPVGASCPDPYACAKGAYCKAGTCVALGAIGASCTPYSFPSACQQGSWCNSTTQLCEATRDDGQACTSSDMCKSSHCEQHKCLAGNLVASSDVCGQDSSPSPPPSP